MTDEQLTKLLKIWSGEKYKDVMLPAAGAMTCGQAAEAILSLANRERDRCSEIVSLARFGEIDRDLRSVIYLIDSGIPIATIMKRDDDSALAVSSQDYSTTTNGDKNA